MGRSQGSPRERSRAACPGGGRRSGQPVCSAGAATAVLARMHRCPFGRVERPRRWEAAERGKNGRYRRCIGRHDRREPTRVDRLRRSGRYRAPRSRCRWRRFSGRDLRNFTPRRTEPPYRSSYPWTSDRRPTCATAPVRTARPLTSPGRGPGHDIATRRAKSVALTMPIGSRALHTTTRRTRRSETCAAARCSFISAGRQITAAS